jgi:ribosomal protein S12 methylthiotransferase
MNITQVFRLHPECFDAGARATLAGGDSPFEFEGLHYVASVEDSIALTHSKEPAIVIAAGGVIAWRQTDAAERVDWVRLLYLYPSDLTDELIDAILGTGVPYFDLSLQHVSRPLMRRMRRWGDGERFLNRIADIRAQDPSAVFRSNFIVGYPGETEEDHDQLIDFVHEAQLDWCGFFSYSPEDGTHAAGLDGEVPDGLVQDRLAELRELQDGITAARRDQLIGSVVEALVDTPGQARSHREAPEIDGIITVPTDRPAGTVAPVLVTDALGPDLVGEWADARPATEVVAAVGVGAP